MNKHTPGPYFSEAESSTCVKVKSLDYGTIAVLHDPLAEESGRTAELEATGALLAAAPMMKTDIEDSRWLLRELLSRCTDPEWRGKIEAQIKASDTVLALAGVE